MERNLIQAKDDSTQDEDGAEELSSDHASADITPAGLERFNALTLKGPDSLAKENPTSSGTDAAQAQSIETEKKNPADFYKFRLVNIRKAPASNRADAINNVQRIPGGDENIAADFFEDLDDSEQPLLNFNQTLDELSKELKRVCEDFTLIQPIMVIALPNSRVNIVGKNVETAKPQIMEALKGFGLKIDVYNSSTNNHGIEYTEFHSYEVAKMMLESGEWTSKGKSHCELFLLAEDRKSGKEVKYAVVPAHLILTEEQTSEMDCMNVDISVIREDFEQQKDDCKYVFRDEKGTESHDLLEPPLLAYRYWAEPTAIEAAQSGDATEVLCPDKDSYPVMNDMALLKFKHPPRNTTATKLNIFRIPTKKHLDLLAERQQTILVGDLEGRLIYCPRSVGNGDEQYGLHLAYIITSKDSDGKTRKLEQGDSGLIVYLRGKHGKRFPVGMHVGKFAEDLKGFDSAIYQAVVLDHALKEIEHEYQNVISNLQLLETGHPYEMKPMEYTPKNSLSASKSRAEDSSSNVESDVDVADAEVYQVWYRHTGQAELKSIPSHCKMNELSLAEIMENVGSYSITHLRVKGGNIRPLLQRTPNLQHLKVEQLKDSSQLQSLCALTRLKDLNLSKNDFSKGLPDVVARLTALETFRLMCCNLTDLPRSLCALTQLMELDLSDNDFRKGLPSVVATLTTLETLRLRSCNLTDLPMSLRALNRLRELELSCNDFSKGLPDVVARLTTLETFRLCRCKLTDLPQSLCALTRLKHLNMSKHNFSKGLPDVVARLTTLETLQLMSCNLTDLPMSLCALTQLMELDLLDNNFRKGLPNVVARLTTLETLRLMCCNLTDLPQSLCALTQLMELALSYNNFSCGLPKIVARLTSLVTLRLMRCNLTDLPISLSLLTQLMELDLSYNNFSCGLPSVVVRLTTLVTLRLISCNLTDLPQRFSCESLESMDLGSNNFECIPPAIHHLSNLKELDLQYNEKLQRLDEEISKLQKLEQLWCYGCEACQSPPYAVCRQGLEAVKKYFADLRVEEGKELLLVPVAVVGMKSSGKSSLIKSLQAGERRLTFRDENSSLDETTKVFAIKELELEDCRVKFVDYGGHEIYHLAYQLVIKERCIPLIVVNIEEFHKLSRSEGVEEATRKLCINWCSHLYLACPRLGPPLLILTHTDKLAVDEVKQCKEQLLTTAEAIRSEIVNETQQCSGEFFKSAQPMVHFSNKEVKLFNPMDVFEFSNDLTERSNIENLKASLENHCKSFKVEIPRLWEKVEEFVNEQHTKSYISLSEVTNKFSSNDPQIILRYMHNVGKILWFEEVEELKSYIFHDIPAITEMISLLLHHSSGEQWKQRVAKFRAFKCDQEIIGKKQYISFVEQFTTTGVISCILLEHLLTTGSKFPIKIAIDLLKGFFILHGPIEGQGQRDKAYILPYFASTCLDDPWLTDGPIPLRVDIVFGGLSPPQYVYQLMTVIVLNHTASRLTDVSVRQNGVSIRHDDCATHLIHGYFNRKLTLQVSSTVAKLVKSWSHLIQLVKSLLNMLSRVWKACYTEVMVYCAQCLISSQPNPAFEVSPQWLSLVEVGYDIANISTVTATSALEKVACPRCGSSSKGQRPAVPKPLRYPCQQLSMDEMETLEYHISAVQRSHPPQRPVGEESDISDVEVEGYCDTTYNIHLSQCMRLKVVRDERIKLLYTDSDKVYLMSDGVRGRALIFNINRFSNTARDRDGSTVDHENISKLFIDLKFDIAMSQDLTAEEIYKVIREETQREVHHKLGMFVLVIMSHGGSRDILKDCKNQPVPLINIQDLLSPSNFSAMKDKPKLIIVQACSGDRADYGDRRELPPLTAGDVPLTVSVPSEQNRNPPAVPLPPTTLNADDFMIMKASSESYLSTRSHSHGSWFIRVLVATFYRHCCHRDVESLFKIIQQRVRQVSLKHKSAGTGDYLGGNVPTSICTFTNYRKLYLFPGLGSTR